MLFQLSMIGVAVFLVWLLFVAFIMLLAPRRALGGLARMGSTPAIHFGEHVLRFLAGFCLVGVSADARGGSLILAAGLFIAASSVLIMLLPRRWHAAYARWWAEHLSEWVVRVLAIPTFVLVVLMVGAVWKWPV